MPGGTGAFQRVSAADLLVHAIQRERGIDTAQLPVPRRRSHRQLLHPRARQAPRRGERSAPPQEQQVRRWVGTLGLLPCLLLAEGKPRSGHGPESRAGRPVEPVESDVPDEHRVGRDCRDLGPVATRARAQRRPIPLAAAGGRRIPPGYRGRRLQRQGAALGAPRSGVLPALVGAPGRLASAPGPVH